MIREKIKTEALKQSFQKDDGTINVTQLIKEANKHGSKLQKTQLKNYLNGSNDLQGKNIEKLLKVLKLEVYSSV